MEVCGRLHAPSFSPRSPISRSWFSHVGEEGIKLRVLEGPACRLSLYTDCTVQTALSQLHCPDNIVPTALSQLHCPDYIVPAALSQLHCPDYTVPTSTSLMVGGKFVRFGVEPGPATTSHSPEIRLHWSHISEVYKVIFQFSLSWTRRHKICPRR
jgi:hypothetical protein